MGCEPVKRRVLLVRVAPFLTWAPGGGKKSRLAARRLILYFFNPHL
jgi:hypothetical protein